MANTRHEVRADLVVDPKNAQRGFAQAGDASLRFERQVGSARSAVDGLFTKVLSMGAAYVSLSGGLSIFSRLTSSAIKYTSALEGTKIGLSSIMSAVENVPWQQATKMAETAFERIKKMSITSPGSAQDMFGIFNGIVGPIRAAGAPLEKVYQLTNDTTLAAAALGVDFQQASRDINMMARGTAGVDVKMFSLLKSTGAIKEDAEAWNKKLTPIERVEKLGAALKKFAGSGEEFGNSWAGVMSTFDGLTDELKRTTFTPLMKAITRSVGSLNDILTENADVIAESFHFLGTSMARFWESTVGRLDMDRVVKGFEAGAVALGKGFQTASHWADALVQNWSKLTAGLEKAMPMLKLAAGLYLGNRLMGAAGGSGGVGGALGAGAGGASKTTGGDWRGTAAKAQAMGNGLLGSGLGPIGGYASKKATEGMTWSRAAVASLLIPFAAPGFLGSAYLNSGRGQETEGAAASGGGGGGGGGPFGSFINSASAAIVVTEHWSRINAAFGPTVEEAVQSTTNLAASTGRAGMAVGRIWGQFEVFGAGLATMFAPALSKAQDAVAGIMDHVTIWADRINYYLAPAFDFAINKMGEIAGAISRMLDPLAKFFKVATNAGWENETPELNKAYDLPDWASGGRLAAKALSTPDARKPSSVVNVNASGARVQIKQEFGNQDPDRVVSLMMLDLEKQAENRLSSAFAGAFTR